MFSEETLGLHAGCPSAPGEEGPKGTKIQQNMANQRHNMELKRLSETFLVVSPQKILLQRLIVIAQLSHSLTDRTDLGAHYEKLNFDLNKEYIWDNITGLLLKYPSCMLHIIESSRDVLISILKDLRVMQQKPESSILEAKIVFMDHSPQSRLFQQWSYKVLNPDQVNQDTDVQESKEEENIAESLVCAVVSAVEKLGKHLDTSKAPPGSVLDETPELIIPQKILERLLRRHELQSSQQYLQMYNSPLNISTDFGNTYEQLREKAKHFSAYSVALDESTDNTDTAQLAIYS
ncbi:testis-expressed protein 47 [Pholidichthys leucotaenia]